MKKFFKVCSAVLAALVACGSWGFLGSCKKTEPKREYGENYRPETQEVDQSLLAGMMYISYEGHKYNNVDICKGLDIMHNLGVKRIRGDLPVSDAFPAPSERNEEVISFLHDVYKYASERNIEYLGGAYTAGYHPDTGWSWDGLMPRRDTSEGSYYMQWLEAIEEYNYVAAKEFPELKIWEMGNEPNGNPFIYYDGSVATAKESAAIYTDVIYYASKGVHRADKDNLTMLGGLTELAGLGTTGGNVQFLNDMYDCIDSGEFPAGEEKSTYPDDYFQIACWHPYTFNYMDPDYFVEENDKIYNCIKEREGKHKKVIFSEFGFSAGSGSGITSKWIFDLFDVIRTRMPYVETSCWFRAFNDNNDKNWGGDSNLINFGLFYDPNHTDASNGSPYEGTGFLKDMGILYIPGEPKPHAYAYQVCAGGSGDLTGLMMSKEKIVERDNNADKAALLENDVLPKRYNVNGESVTYTQCKTRTKELFEEYAKKYDLKSGVKE